MRLAIMLVFVTVVCGLVYFVLTHPSLDRLQELETELSHLEAQNQELADRNAELERQILALRDDPRLAERRARESVGMARPHELIFQFDEEDGPTSILVHLEVRAQGLELAGEEIEMAQLEDRLAGLAEELPGAELRVRVDESVGPIERQRVVDIVEASRLGPGKWEDEG